MKRALMHVSHKPHQIIMISFLYLYQSSSLNYIVARLKKLSEFKPGVVKPRGVICNTSKPTTQLINLSWEFMTTFLIGQRCCQTKSGHKQYNGLSKLTNNIGLRGSTWKTKPFYPFHQQCVLHLFVSTIKIRPANF